MPAKSKQQQKFFGVVKAMQKGDIPKKGEAGDVADDMTKKEVDKMASTKHKGLPKKIKEMIEEEYENVLNEGAKYKRGQSVTYQIDRGSPKALKPSHGTISKVQKVGNYYQYTIQDGGPVPVWEIEILQVNESVSEVKKDAFKLGYRIPNVARAKSHFKQGEEIAAVSKSGKGIIKIKDISDFSKYPTSQWNFAYITEDKDPFVPTYGKGDVVHDCPKHVQEMKSGKKGKVVSHTLNEAGDVNYVDVDFGTGKIYENIPTKKLKILEGRTHEHAVKDEPNINETKSAKALKADYDKAVKKEQALSSLLLVNLEKYKSAKAKGDEKAIAKHTKIAADLSKKKRAASEVAQTAYQAYEDAISGLHADAELDLKEGKLNEEDYKYKKYVTKAFDDVSDAIFDFRNAMGVKQLGQADPKIKKQLEAIAVAVFALRRDFVSKNLSESKLNEAEINDPVLVAVRARKEMLKQDAIKWAGYKKLSLDQYWKKLEYRSFLEMRMKEAAEELAQLDSEMNHEAGQKGEEWTDDDANRYGGELDKLQTKIEKLAKAKAKVNKEILYHRTH